MFLYAGIVVDNKSAPTRAAIWAGQKGAMIEIATAKIVDVMGYGRGKAIDVV